MITEKAVIPMHCYPSITSSHAEPPNGNDSADTSHTRVRTIRLLTALLALAIMFVLKRHYSLASADELNWILAPTARLVAWLTPAHPVFEYGVGHADFSRGIIIAPACAGINFLIMAFGLSVYCGLLNLKRPLELFNWLMASFAAAYGYTLLVNTLRIAISMGLYRADIYTGWLTVERIHRVAGTVLYLGALWLLYAAVRRLLRRYRRRPAGRMEAGNGHMPVWLPLAWYLAGTVGVPLVNLWFQPRIPGLGEHCVTLVITGVCMFQVGCGLRRWLANWSANAPCPPASQKPV